MKNYFIPFSYTALLSMSVFVFSCTHSSDKNNLLNEQKNTTPAPEPVEQQNNIVSQLPQITSDKIEVKTFEVKETQGWGYDIYVDSKKMIHQPTIPAIQGNRSFKTEQLALKAGLFAAQKLKNTGTLPTITVKELDSIGVIK